MKRIVTAASPSAARAEAGAELAEGTAEHAEPAPGPLPLAERRAWMWLLIAATLLRVFALGDRPFHHDESVHAWFCDRLANEGEYKYDPVYHGPVQYAMVASTFKLARALGKIPPLELSFLRLDPGALFMRDMDAAQKGFELRSGDFFARLPAALGGVALVWLALLLRPRFGPKVALAAGILTAISPNLLYYTRFCREDVWSLLGTAGTFLFFDAWWREGKLRWLVYSSLSAAVAFAAKENFYVLMALMAPSIAAYCWVPGEGPDVWRRLHKLLDFLEAHATAIAGALLLFFVVSELLYTVFLVHIESGNPAKDAISYWWGQHKVARVGGPKHYYLPRLLQYEFAVLIPAFAYIFRNLRRLTGVERFLAGWGVSSIAMYAYLGEKTPWLIVHQIIPFIPLAAIEWARIWDGFRARSPEVSLPVRALAALGAVACVLTALSLSFWNSSLTPKVNRAESVIYVQTSPEVLDLAHQITAEARPGVDPVASIIGEANWPLNWYLRRLPVSWSLPDPNRKPRIAIVDSEKAEEAAKTLGPEYTQEEIPLRSWWIPEVGLKPLKPNPAELVKYVFTREPWSIIGAQKVTVFKRKTP